MQMDVDDERFSNQYMQLNSNLSLSDGGDDQLLEMPMR
jgi:hypothetical protein